MNILPKKRWHVRTKENIARVRKDEAAAAEVENEKIRRAKLGEQEARTAYLRNQARLKDGREPDRVQPKPSPTQPESTKNLEANIYTSEGNINFFKDLEDGKQTSGTNKEHEAEKKEEQEKYEKSIGYLTYLGQDSLESKGEKPWYETNTTVKEGEPDDPEVGLKYKSRLDPINDIIKYAGLKPKKKVVVGESKSVENPKKVCVINSVYECLGKRKKEDKLCISSKKLKRNGKHKKKCKKEHKSKKRKHKHTHKEKRNSDCAKSYKRSREKDSKYSSGCKRKRVDKSDSENNSDVGSKSTHKKHKRRRSDTIESELSENSDGSLLSSSSEEDEEEQREKQKRLDVLRSERLKREAEEKRKAEKLLASLNPSTVEAVVNNNPSYQQKYNSQYNPHLARQNLEPTTQEPTSLKTGIKYWIQ